MVEFVNTVDIVGDEALSNSIIDKSITEIADNHATKIGNSAFKKCAALTVADFRAVTNLEQSALSTCTALTTADFSMMTSIGQYVFYKCTALTALILRSETVCTLSNANALDDTPIKSGTGYIYVPRALVDTYKAATNWSKYVAQFRALEDYTVDGTTTGELDSTKI